jgi:predicted ester cyclase
MWNTRNLAVIDEVCAPSPDGQDGIKQFVATYLDAFPDGHHTIQYQVAEGETVVTRYTGTGIHLGQLADIPPTGERMTVEAVETHHFAGGKLVEVWRSLDLATAFQPLRLAANRALARRWYDDFVNAHNVVALDELVAPDFISHFLSGSPGRTIDELK